MVEKMALTLINKSTKLARVADLSTFLKGV